MASLPADLIHFVILRFLSYRDQGNVSAVCKEWRRFMLQKHAKIICNNVISNDLLREANMCPFELLDLWQIGSTKMACGGRHGAIISTSGTVSLWREGERRVQLLAKGANQLVACQVSCGYSHTLIVSKDGRVYALGSNSKGELGVGDTEHRDTPTRVFIEDRVQTALAGNGFSVFLTTQNKLYVCGQLDISTVPISRNTNTADLSEERFIQTPREILFNQLQPGERISLISAGGAHILVLTDRNRLFSAGAADNFQLGRVSGEGGLPNKDLHQVLFMPPPDFPTIVQISAGASHSLVLLGDGSVYSFGKSTSGELGLPKFQDAKLPIRVPNLPRALAISAGDRHSLILTVQENKVFAFGLGALGQLGYRGSFWSSSYPRDSTFPKESSKRIRYISAGSGFSMCLSGDGEGLYACGKSSLCAGAGHGEHSGTILPIFTRVPD